MDNIELTDEEAVGLFALIESDKHLSTTALTDKIYNDEDSNVTRAAARDIVDTMLERKPAIIKDAIPKSPKSKLHITNYGLKIFDHWVKMKQQQRERMEVVDALPDIHIEW